MNQLNVEKMTSARIPTELGEFQLCHYRNNVDKKEHLALVKGKIQGKNDVLVRVHSECFTGDVLGSLRCDCGPQLQTALHLIAEAESGIIIYLRQEGRGIGLLDKLRAYNLQDDGFDTVEANLMLGHQADSRDYTIASLILKDLGVQSIRLLTNNPQKIESLHDSGVTVNSRIPLQTEINQENAAYLQTKVSRMHHMLDLKQLSQSVANNGHPNPIEKLEPTPSTHQKRPSITITYAQSLDGSITTRSGETLIISGPESLKMTHQMRADHDAILVGIGTVLADDPRLTVRLVDGPDPQPIVLDSQLRFPPQAKLLKNRKPWLITTPTASQSKQAFLESLGARVIRIPASDKGDISLPQLIDFLATSGIESLMVEGGAAVIAGFLHDKLADQLVITIAPKLIGGLNPLINHETPQKITLPKIEDAKFQLFGKDIVMTGNIIYQ